MCLQPRAVGSRDEDCHQDYRLKRGRNGALERATGLPAQETNNAKPENPSEAGSVCWSRLLQQKAVYVDTHCDIIAYH